MERQQGNAGERAAEGVRVRVRGAFEPARVVVPAGAPVRLVFRREETDECSQRVIFPDYQWVADLEPFRDTVVELPPRGAGEHEFSCAEGRIRGKLVVASPEQPRTDGAVTHAPLVAAALSFLAPGLGHFLIRSWVRGAIWLTGWLIVGAASGVQHGPAVLLLMLVAAIDAYALALSHPIRGGTSRDRESNP
jgi:hypothetical protein